MSDGNVGRPNAFAGRALVDALLSTHTIYALSHARSLDGKFPLSVVTKQLDLTDKDAVRSA